MNQEPAFSHFNRYGPQPVRKAAPPPPLMTDLEADQLISDWIPGDAPARSDDVLAARVRADVPTLPPGDVPSAVYARRQMAKEASDEQFRRKFGPNSYGSSSNALSKPGRTAVQMQVGAPSKPVPTVKTPANATAIRPIPERSTEELQNMVAMAPQSLPLDPTPRDYAAMDDARAAKAELVRRARDPRYASTFDLRDGLA